MRETLGHSHCPEGLILCLGPWPPSLLQCSGLSKARIWGDSNWTYSMVTHCLFLLDAPRACLFMESLFSWSADKVRKSEKSATSSVHCYPWWHYGERLWGPEGFSCLRPQAEVKRVDSLTVRETPSGCLADFPTRPFNQAPLTPDVDLQKVSC